MKVLLIYPEYPNTFWSFKSVLKFIAKKAAFPPLGLLTIAAMLPKSWDKKLVDVNVASVLKNEEIEWADMVFISAMIVQKNSAQEIIKRCKNLNKKIVAGGPLFSAQKEQFEYVDHLVLDEAEITLPFFLKDLEQGIAKRIYTSSERPQMSQTPIPLWNLIRFKDYSTMLVQFSRGCPFDCEFCDIVVMNGRIPRTKNSKQMIYEMQSIYDAGWRGSVFIVDDNFIGNKIKVKEFLNDLIQWQKSHQYAFRFLTEASVNLAEDEDLMNLMSEANFFKIFLGIESPCMDSLKECGKKQNIKADLPESIRKIHQHGMQVMGGFIVGFDNDVENIFDLVVDFIQQNSIVTAMVGILNALPRTKLWYRLKSEGRLLGDSSGENTSTGINFLPKMEIKKLEEGYKKIFSTIYNPKKYYQRINQFLIEYQPKARTKIKLEDVRAFARSTWRIGVFSRARFLYWKLLIKTLLTKKDALPMAIELAIFGLHFESTSKRM
ncbi:B12-binding domain-containing radical SAM protein [Patescibacteria group bacterium]